MTIKHCAKLLRQLNKWRKNKGRKYASPGIPFSTEDIDAAIDMAVKILSAIPPADDIAPSRTGAITRIHKFTDVIRNEQAQ
jgi:hypothetical protein